MEVSNTKAQFRAKHAEALRLFEAGHGYKRVAAELNLSIYTVRDWSRNWRYGVEPRSVGTDEEREKANVMRRAGASLMDISRELKVPKRTVLAWLAQGREGLPNEGRV